MYDTGCRKINVTELRTLGCHKEKNLSNSQQVGENGCASFRGKERPFLVLASRGLETTVRPEHEQKASPDRPQVRAHRPPFTPPHAPSVIQAHNVARGAIL